MTVRARLVWVLALAGLFTAAGVVATVLVAFQRFEHESAYYRGTAFLDRVVAAYPDLLVQQRGNPQAFEPFLRNLVLYEPETRLYLLDAEGLVLASTQPKALPAGFKVAIAPVREAAGPKPMPYVMGDDPERMEQDTVVSARALRLAGATEVAGYLYYVCHKMVLPPGRLEALRSTFALPTLVALAVLVGAITLLSAWLVASITRPLRELTEAVDAVARNGLTQQAPEAARSLPLLPALAAQQRRDEFGRLATGFAAMLQRLQSQWQALARLDHFRRESVANLSHDLRSPLTATTACLETLQQRLAHLTDEQALVAVALRNTRNAARLVQSLGELAQLDEPAFALRRERVNLNELLDDIALRFGDRARSRGVSLSAGQENEPVAAEVDVELIERAVANLVDNALAHAQGVSCIHLAAEGAGQEVTLCVTNNGQGIEPAEQPSLFDRYHQPRRGVAPATGEGGKGLGLAIVKRIAELHGGRVELASTPASGTRVTLWLPMQAAGPGNPQ